MTQPPDTTKESRAELKDSVLTSIKEGRVSPKPWWYFFCGECLMSTLWVISVIVGAFAVAVILHVGTHSAFALVEATHRTMFAFVFDVLPYLWVGVFVLMAVAAVYYYRHTKLGYRRSIFVLLGSSVFLSLTGGIVLHALGAGAAMDNTFAQYMPMYSSMEQKELAMWQRPSQGRIVGVPEISPVDEARIPFTDIKGTTWQLDVRELHDVDIDMLKSGEVVRVVGFASSTAEMARFLGCGVFSWMYNTSTRLANLQAEREEFISRMNAHRPAPRDAGVEMAQLARSASTSEEHRCAAHATVRRIQPTKP